MQFVVLAYNQEHQGDLLWNIDSTMFSPSYLNLCMKQVKTATACYGGVKLISACDVTPHPSSSTHIHGGDI